MSYGFNNIGEGHIPPRPRPIQILDQKSPNLRFKKMTKEESLRKAASLPQKDLVKLAFNQHGVVAVMRDGLSYNLLFAFPDQESFDAATRNNFIERPFEKGKWRLKSKDGQIKVKVNYPKFFINGEPAESFPISMYIVKMNN